MLRRHSLYPAELRARLSRIPQTHPAGRNPRASQMRFIQRELSCERFGNYGCAAADAAGAVAGFPAAVDPAPEAAGAAGGVVLPGAELGTELGAGLGEDAGAAGVVSLAGTVGVAAGGAACWSEGWVGEGDAGFAPFAGELTEVPAAGAAVWGAAPVAGTARWPSDASERSGTSVTGMFKVWIVTGSSRSFT